MLLAERLKESDVATLNVSHFVECITFEQHQIIWSQFSGQRR